MPKTTLTSRELDQLVKFHNIIEGEAINIQYGQITFNVFIKNCVPILSTINVVRQKRKKYPLPKVVYQQIGMSANSYLTTKLN